MSNVENVCPQVLRGVARELRRLAASPPAGIKLLLRDDDLTDVVAHMEGPADTPYAGGTFRVRLVLGREFPTAPPRAFFLTKLFHPNVSPDTGEVCVNTLKRDWRPELGLEHALLAVKCLLIAPNAESALNAEAAALLRDRYDDYFARAKLLTDIHARAAPVPALRRKEDSSSCAEGPVGERGARVEGAGGARTEGGVRGEGGAGAARAEGGERGDGPEGGVRGDGPEGSLRGEAGAGGARGGSPAAKRERRTAPAPRDKRRVLKRL